jgi:DNA-binding MarR family transcriptional regulator
MNNFEDEMDRRLGSRLKRAEQVLSAEKARVLRPFELTVPQYATLLYLRHVTAASAAQLARASLVSPQTMATILTNLELKGLVERTTSLLHQKVLETRLTEAGSALVDSADVVAKGVEERILAALGAHDAEMLKKLLDVAIGAIGATGDAD